MLYKVELDVLSQIYYFFTCYFFTRLRPDSLASRFHIGVNFCTRLRPDFTSGLTFNYAIKRIIDLKKALITGITGQDGSYLSEFLLSKGYDVHGLIRGTSQFSRTRIESTRQHAKDRDQVFELHYGDLSDTSSPLPSENTVRARLQWIEKGCKGSPPAKAKNSHFEVTRL